MVFAVVCNALLCLFLFVACRLVWPVVVSCGSIAACCLLFVMCCLVIVVRCLLAVVCCLLFGIRVC